MVIETPLSMVKGDTKYLKVVFDGMAVTLESAYFSCKKNKFDEEYVFQKTLSDGITQTDDTEYTVRIAPEDTASLDYGDYYYDLQIGANSDIFTPLIGTLKIVQDITEE